MGTTLTSPSAPEIAAVLEAPSTGATGQRSRSGHGISAAFTVWCTATGAPATGSPSGVVTRSTTGAKVPDSATDCPAPLTMASRQSDGADPMAAKLAQAVVHAQA